MIIMKHRHKSEPEHWIFACKCGCEWVTDLEMEICDKDYSYPDVYASCRCPECNDLVFSKCHISSEEYDKIYEKAFNEKEESH